ncbi:UNVERIFIED_CONTAM: hypothetical protein GTU68_049508 [Idotea baltica]|nr:hypothetical protein [Idotea baltica]
MLEAMFAANVGDDVYGEDPEVNTLQEKLAAFFGTEAGLFCPSGTMCNQIAIKLSTQPQSEVICEEKSHIYLYEGGGIAANSMASVRLLKGDFGRITHKSVEANINADNEHFSVTSLVSLENTSNKGGGSCYKWEEIANISEVCKKHDLRLHLDGARIFNALIAKGDDPKKYGEAFNTISICLSKGLGAPVGSVLLGSKKDIKQAVRVRKLFGGGMRQAGYLAAAGIYALDNHVDRLAEDHHRAKVIGKVLENLSWVVDVMPIETNIIGFKPDPTGKPLNQILDELKSQDILANAFGNGYLRFVTHLDITDQMTEKLITALKQL